MNSIVEEESRDKRKNLYLFLSGFFITNALIAEMVGSKIFSAEATLGLAQAQINIFGTLLDFNLTAGTVLWPFVFISTDIINEYFGKAGVRQISIITAGLIAYAFLIIGMATLLEPSQFWLENNKIDSLGNPLNVHYAFNTIFRQGMNIIVGSLTAFVIAQLVDVYVFHRLRKFTGTKMLWLRATGSTLVSQLIDSIVVLFVAFYLMGNWSLLQVTQVALLNYLAKGILALLLTPVLYLVHNAIDKYLGKEQSDKMMADAAQSSESLF